MKTKKNEVISLESSRKYLQFLLYLVFLSSLFIKLQMISFIPPKYGIPLADPGEYFDFFNIFKVDFLIFISFIMLPIFYIYIKKIDVKFDGIDYTVFALSTAVVFSIFKSDYINIALWGTHERFTSSVFFLIIIFLFFVASKIAFSRNVIKKFDFLLGLFLIINVVLAIAHHIGIDLLNNEIFQKIIMVPESSRDYISGYIMGTLENPNYLSGFCGPIAIMFLVRYTYSEKKIDYNFLLFGLSILLILLSFSSSGNITFIFSLTIFLAFIALENFNINIKNFLLSIVLYLILSFSMFFSDDRISDEIKSTFTIIYKYFYLLIFVFIIFSIVFWLSKKEKILFLLKEKFNFIIIFLLLFVTMFVFLFPASPDYGKHFPEKMYSEKEIRESIEKSNTITETLFTNREFMWWYTLDLIKEKPFTGYGMSSLIFEYPQLSHLKIEKIGNTIVTKPHNHYLEVLYGSGILALSFFLLIFVYLGKNFFLANSIQKDNYNNSLFFLMIAFLIQGLVNDMAVGTYPIIFVLLGVLNSRCNMYIKEGNKNG